LKEPIKDIGEHDVHIAFNHGLEADIRVNICEE